MQSLQRVKKYWLWYLCERFFPKSLSLIINETLTKALHPEFGWVWFPEEQGGKYIAQARAQGWKDCFAKVLVGRGRENEDTLEGVNEDPPIDYYIEI